MLGMFKAMRTTLKHLPMKKITVQYPEEKLAPQENARTIPFLVYDGNAPLSGLRCTACTICAQE